MRLRQPAALVALVALVLHAVLVMVSVRETSLLPEGYELGYLSSAVIQPVLLLLLTTVVLTCWLGVPTRGARSLTVAALIVTALLSGVVVGLGVAGVIAMPWAVDTDPLDFYRWLLPALTVAGLSLAVQIALLRRPVTRSAAALQTGPIPAELGSEPESEPAPDPELQPTWQTDQAVGTVWRRAGEASPQTAATDWDASGETGGWWSTEPDRGPLPEPRSRDES